MAIIEGLGDEVTILFTAIIILISIYFVYWNFSSTSLQQQPPDEHQPVISDQESVVNENISNLSDETVNSNSNNITAPSSDSRSQSEVHDESMESSQRAIVNDSTLTRNTETPLEGNATEIRIQYVDGRQRHVVTSLDDTIGNFKRVNFTRELGVGEMVRLIACGRELRDEAATLRNSGLNDNGVLHCLITKPPDNARSLQQQQPNTEVGSRIAIGQLLVPLFVGVLMLLWYVRLAYRSAFTGFSTFLLIVMTTIFLGALMLSLVRQLRIFQITPERPHLQ